MNRPLLFWIFLALCPMGFADLKTGDQAPDFTLPSVDGKTIKLSDYQGKIVVLEWFNMGCPFVQKHYREGDMQALQKEYTDRGIIWLTVNSTNPKHQNYLTLDQAKNQVEQLNIHSTAMLQDADGKVGKRYGAKSTPHMFIVNQEGKLVYQGAIDDQPNTTVSPRKANNYVRAALADLMAGKPVTVSTTKQYGCGVKYAD